MAKGENKISGNFGGPLIGFAGTTIPIPFTAVNYDRGLTDNITGHASLHITALAYGVAMAEIGTGHYLYRNDSIRIGITAFENLNFSVDRWEKNFKLWPQLDLNFYRENRNRNMLMYAGISNWFELSRYKAFNERQPEQWLFSPQLGVQRTGKKGFTHGVELKLVAIASPNTNIVVDYKTPLNKGAIGIYYTFSKSFGK